MQVSINQKPLLTAMADNFEAAIEKSPEGVESKELLVQCSSVILLDCSCGLPMYRAAIVIEPSIPDDFAIRAVIQRSRVYYPSNEYQQGIEGHAGDGSHSPTKAADGQPAGRAPTSGKSNLKPQKVCGSRACYPSATHFGQFVVLVVQPLPPYRVDA